MKTKRNFTVLSFTICLFAITTAFTVAKNDPSKIQSTGGNAKFITYVVNILHDNESGFNCDYVIAILDDKGNPVAAPQTFQRGVWSYSFRESADVKTSRMAVMERRAHSECPASFNFRNSTLPGPFESGFTYKFTIRPVMLFDANADNR